MTVGTGIAILNCLVSGLEYLWSRPALANKQIWLYYISINLGFTKWGIRSIGVEMIPWSCV